MCGIFGVYNNNNASKLTYLGLHALQHRGQEAVGIAVSNRYEINMKKAEGLVMQSLDEKSLNELKGDIAIGHVRYSTSGKSNPQNVQPFLSHFYKGSFAVAHNGNIVNADLIREELEKEGAIFYTTSDTEVFIHLIAKAKDTTDFGINLHPNDREFLPLLFSAMKKVKGAYSLLILRENQLIAVRDPFGFRPLVLGKNKQGSIFLASESCALDIVEAEYLRDLKAGEVLVIDGDGLRSYYPLGFVDKAYKCIFEYVYFSRPDSIIFQDYVYSIRKEMGRQLAREMPIDADVVVPVLDSGMLSAKGYSEESGIPLEIGLIRNHYIGRSFIQPIQEIRDLSVKLKLNPVRQVVEGKRIILIDDSLVRGTTAKKIVRMLRRAGAKEIHFLISSPPVVSPCVYGIDTPTKEELIASSKSVNEIKEYIGVDTLYYLSLEGMIKSAMNNKNKGFCTACFTGDYPVL
ncbi:MAG: amidophosphoribosyltransferase [Persephonella sp.]|nr:MAG: amidophosphoribosyltransferase [Persephonella sp.]